MVERTQTEFLLAQADLVEKARDASQLAAKRAQDAETRTKGLEGQTKVLRDGATDALAAVVERQEQIEETIGANVPDHEWSGTQLRLRNADGEWGDYTNLIGPQGDAGWAPVLVVETDGERRVQRVVDWTGGAGTKPTATGYVGASGLVETAAEAVDVRGATGAAGEAGTNGTNGTGGADGEDGLDGVGVVSAAINVDGELVLTLSDASTTNAGEIPIPQSATRDLIRLAMEVSVLKGSTVGLDSGVVDEFEDAAGVDAGSSTGETAATGHFANGPIAEASQSLPAMTSNSLPSGHVASFGSGSNAATAEPYRAFDQASSRAFSSAIPDTLVRQVPSGIKVASYRITSSSTDTEINRAPTAWTLEGSNNGSSWTTLDTRSGISWSAGASVQQTFEIDAGSRGSYTYHRLNFSAVNGSTSFVINELEFFQEEFAAMDLRSVAVALPFTPSLASLVIAAKPDGGTITPDTDVIAYASRDGGTTWTQGNLVARQTLGDGTVMLETGEFDISAQPSGTSGKWRVVTSDGFEMRIQAVAILFGG